jgi:hypothetical protein
MQEDPARTTRTNAHISCVSVGEHTIQSEPDESLDELMDSEQRGKRCDEQFAPVLHLIDICINNAIMDNEVLKPYAQTEGERRSS